MLNSNLKGVFKKWKLSKLELKKNLIKNINKLKNRNSVPSFGHNFFNFNIFKNGFRIWIQHETKKIM